MNCCNPFLPIIDYVEDMNAQPSVIHKLIELSKEWEDLNARVKKLEENEYGGDIPPDLVARLNALEILCANLTAQIETIETDTNELKTKLNSLEIEVNTQNHLIEQNSEDIATNTSSIARMQTTVNTNVGRINQLQQNKLEASTFNEFKTLNDINKADSDAGNLSVADIQAWQEKVGGISGTFNSSTNTLTLVGVK